MQHFIDPTIDCVFKAILSAPGNENLLVSFLNGVLELKSPIATVDILNPYNDKEFIGDKLSIVDIKATDDRGVIYQIEVQLSTPKYLENRMLYTWSSVYKSQVVEGDGYSELKPAISIWLLTGTFFKTDQAHHHHFQVWDVENQLRLTDHCSVHVLELEKWEKPATLQAQDYWLYFFKEAKHWKSLPQLLQGLAVMRQAMNTLVRFSEQQKEYHRYQSRLDQIRVLKSDEALMKEAMGEVKAVRAELETAKAETETVKAEVEASKAETATLKTESETLRTESETLRTESETLRTKTETARAEVETAQSQNELLMAQLRQAGIEPKLS
jgi:predicted transposase/invertase (TIGR01784 family)